MKILVTGGTGFIGSHTVVELLNCGHEVVVIDNLSNSNAIVLNRIFEITGKNVDFYNIDIRNYDDLDELFQEHEFDCCIHFAGLKAVGESVEKPILYYDNNVVGTLNLLKIMGKNNCKNIIFSSSATVYGTPEKMPITENEKISNATNPYGQSKIIIEGILNDLYKADNEWNIVLLRYFNPIGAHKSSKIGENPFGVPNNLMPYVTQVAIGKREFLSIFGNDYDTKDGTCIRDYIHVVDLAKGHVCALKNIMANKGLSVYNLGTGKGYSVLDVVQTFERVNGVKIPYKFAPRRDGDVMINFADATKAKQELGWVAENSLDDMCKDAWNWQKNNPDGFR